MIVELRDANSDSVLEALTKDDSPLSMKFPAD
jgi:hypothetical protein